MAAHDRFRRTRLACYAAYVVQAVVNNFAPLLFVTFSVAYGIPLSRMALLVTFNFGTQLCVDALSAVFVDRIGYRRTVILAHLCAALGMGALPSSPPCSLTRSSACFSPRSSTPSAAGPLRWWSAR